MSSLNIPDLGLVRAINYSLYRGYDNTTPIDSSDIASLTNLVANHRGIKDLTGIENFINLVSVTFSANQIQDITPLEGLIKLQEINLPRNLVQDISPLKGLTNLKDLSLDNNLIKDISPLKELTSLTSLYLYTNQIEDISPLEGLTNLKTLYLSENQIEDISPLKGLTNLNVLLLSMNQIEDISPLKGLTNLTNLSLYTNQIEDISPLEGLTNLIYLLLSENQIQDIKPLATFPNADLIILNYNKIYDACSISSYTNSNDINKFTLLSQNIGININLEVGEDYVLYLDFLRTIDCNYPQISYPLPSLGDYANNSITWSNVQQSIKDFFQFNSSLHSGNVYINIMVTNKIENKIKDPNLKLIINKALSPTRQPTESITTADLELLTTLHASNSNITDLTGLEYATNLQYLYFKSNKIKDLSPLSNLYNLTRLELSNNQIEEISPLNSLNQLRTLYLDNNHIANMCSISNLNTTYRLNLSDQKIVINKAVNKGENLELNIDFLKNNNCEIPTINIQYSGVTFNSNTITWTKVENSTTCTFNFSGANGFTGIVDVNIIVNEIPDINLQAKINETLAAQTSTLRNPTDPVTSEDLLLLTTLDASNSNIQNLTGLEQAVNLITLNLNKNEIIDISPLNGLGKLHHLYLSQNNIQDITPLAYLLITCIYTLDLSNNEIYNMCPLMDSVCEGESGNSCVNSSNQSINIHLGVNKGEDLELDLDFIKDDTCLTPTINFEYEGAYYDPTTNTITWTKVEESIECSFNFVGHFGFSGIVHLKIIVNEIPDKNLQIKINEALSIITLQPRNPQDPITINDLSILTILDASNANIKDLTGLKYGINLQEINLSNNLIKNIAELSQLTILNNLNLNHNLLIDISPLYSLINLETLDISYNQLLDLAYLSKLTKLEYLNISYNQICDIHILQRFAKLSNLLANNQTISINDRFDQVESYTLLLKFLKDVNSTIPLIPYISNSGVLSDNGDSITWKNVSSLSTLQIYFTNRNNFTGNISVNILPNQPISMEENLAKEIRKACGKEENSKIPITIKDLESITTLNIKSKNISNISSLIYCVNLVSLEASDNQIQDITPLANLSKLQRLNLSLNYISDLTPLQNLTNLILLYLYDNTIEDITPLATLINLKYLNLGYNYINDFSSISSIVANLKEYNNNNQKIK